MSRLPGRPARILLVTHHPGYVRTYESSLRDLLDEGHHVHVAYVAKVKQTDGKIAERLADTYPRLTLERLPKPTGGNLDNLRRGLRLLADFARYQHPRYARATALRERVAGKLRGNPLDKGLFFAVFFRLYLATLGRVRGAAYADGVGRWALRLAEALPAPVAPTQWMRAHEPDLVLVTPHVGVASVEPEYLDAARVLRIPSAYLVASWDNLTNKGLVKSPADRVVVWNETQRDELVELHGVPADRVTVTGAQRFDDWFEMSPSMSTEAFCDHVGLDATQPFILYLCSSPFIAPNEVPFVRRFIKTLRSSSGDLADAGVLVRPHPQNAKQWVNTDFTDLENVTIWPRAGEQPLHGAARTGFYDSMALSLAVVGINTSAQIEAGIVGKTVHTVRTDAFADTQDGTLHFKYLLAENGGLLFAADDLKALVADLEGVHAGEAGREQTRRFVEHFVRPHGLDRRASPLVTAAIRELLDGPAETSVQLRRPTLLQHLQIWPLAALCLPLSRSEAQSSLRNGVRAAKRVLRREGPAIPPLVRGAAASSITVEAWDGDRAGELLYWIPYVHRRLRSAPIGTTIEVRVGATADPRWYGTFTPDRVVMASDAPPDEAARADPDHIVITPEQVRPVADGLRAQTTSISHYAKWVEPRGLRVGSTPPAGSRAFTWDELPPAALGEILDGLPVTIVREADGGSMVPVPTEDPAALTDGLSSASLVVTSETAAAALALSLRVPVCLVTGDDAVPGDLDVLDRMALALDVEAIILDLASLRAMLSAAALGRASVDRS